MCGQEGTTLSIENWLLVFPTRCLFLSYKTCTHLKEKRSAIQPLGTPISSSYRTCRWCADVAAVRVPHHHLVGQGSSIHGSDRSPHDVPVVSIPKDPQPREEDGVGSIVPRCPPKSQNNQPLFLLPKHH